MHCWLRPPSRILTWWTSAGCGPRRQPHCGPALRHPYPHTLETGEHGFTVRALSGPYALARLDGSDSEFVVNLGSLAARTINLGKFSSGVPAVQEPLF